MGACRFDGGKRGFDIMADLTFSVRRREGRRPVAVIVLALAAIAGLTLAGAPIAYMLWPQPVPVAVDAPALPITVGGVTFNVPPAAIRVAMQRRPGAQARVDLVFAWPSLEPPAPAARPVSAAPARSAQRLFVTVAASDGTLPPLERLDVIYPRYAAEPEIVGRDGLVRRKFRADSPYRGEELIYDPAVPELPGICLHERRVLTADVTIRFPRDWLDDWRSVAGGIDGLLAKLRPAVR
jgi:hypothetical protein